MSLSSWILVGFVSGIASGLFFGDCCTGLAVFTLLSTSAFLGRLRCSLWPLIRFATLFALLGVMLALGLRITLGNSLRYGAAKDEILAHLQLLEEPVPSVIQLRRKDGTMQEYYDHWILGKTLGSQEPRWSVMRDVLTWVD